MELILENETQVNMFTQLLNHKINKIIHRDSKVALMPENAVKLLNQKGEGTVKVPIALLHFPEGERGIECNVLYMRNPTFIKDVLTRDIFILKR